MNNSQQRSSILPADDEPVVVRRRAIRMFKDRLARCLVTIGGGGAIVAIVLIFFYLLYEVVPLFKPPSMYKVADYVVAPGADTLGFSMDERAEIGVRYTSAGQVIFFQAESGAVIDQQSLPLPSGATVTAFAKGEPSSGVALFGLSNGHAMLVKHRFVITYPNDIRTVKPQLTRFEEPLLALYPDGRPLQRVAVQSNADRTTIIGWSAGAPLSIVRFEKEESFLDDEATLERSEAQLTIALSEVDYLLLDKEQRQLYVANEQGGLFQYDLTDLQQISQVQQVRMVKPGERMTALTFLSGDISLLAGSSSGRLDQWFSVNHNGRPALTLIRSFKGQQNAIDVVTAEFARKGVLAADVSGRVGLYHTTAQRTLLVDQVSQQPITELAVAPRADAFLAQDRSGIIHFWRIENEHPEISWTSLWGKVWYESYPEPAYIWQSSAADNDFEPKFSLTPLGFGTLKAAFYAMLVALPIAILGAIYTAYFMAPGLRRLVKPTIEIMEALPTVILGFLAGLWLAPALEGYLPGFFAALLIIPLGTVLFAWLWSLLPKWLRQWLPDGWLPLLLIPVLLFLTWFSLMLSQPIEQWLFGGDMVSWLSNDLGVSFDQRNSIVVGLAMGFAVIPTIFSITEDAVFSVPKHLTQGSLALGATLWQTMTRVVILTASPGIFSAVMIGFGRAVGETMIVLMATGNTPVMDFSLFQGMRTLAANVAVEVPEAEVASSHFRVLFLAGLVLFLFTFIFNTAAEIVRHRLRKKYSSL